MIIDNRLRRALKVAVMTLVIFAVVIVIALALARAEFARRTLGNYLSRRLSAAAGVTIVIGPMDALTFSTAHLQSLAVSDSQGECAQLNDVSMAWSPTEFLWRRYHVREIRVGSAWVERFPARRKKEPSKPGSSGGTPSALARIHVDRLSVAELALKPPLLPTETKLRINGDLGRGNTASERRCSLSIEPLGGVHMEGDVAAVFRNDLMALDVQANYTESEGGLLARTAGLHQRGPISMKLTGTGPLRDWHAETSLTAGDAGGLNATLAMSTADTMALSIAGTFHVGADSLPLTLKRVIGNEARFAAKLKADWPEAIAIESAEISAALGNLQLAGDVNLRSRTTALEFGIDVLDGAAWEAMTRVSMEVPCPIRGALHGPIRQPTLALDATAHSLHYRGARAASVEGRIELEALGPLARPFPRVRLRGNGKALRVVYDRAPRLPAMDFNWSLDADAARVSSVHLVGVKFESGDLNATLSGEVNLTELAGEVDADLGIARLGPFVRVPGFDASATLHGHVKGDLRQGAASGKLEGTIAEIRGIAHGRTAALAEFAGKTATFSCPFSVGSGSGVVIDAFQAQAENFSLQGRASFDPASKRLSTSYRVEIPKGDALARAIKRPLRASISVAGDIEGVWPALKCEAGLNCEDISFGHENLERFEAALTAENVPVQPHGHIQAAVTRKPEQATLESDWNLQGKALELSPLRITAAQAESSGSLTLDLANRTAHGVLRGQTEDIADLARLLGRDAHGAAQVEATLDARGGRQDVQLRLVCRELTSRLARIEHIEASASLEDLFKSPQGTMALQLDAVQAKGVQLDRVSVACEGDLRRASFNAEAKGQYRRPFAWKVSGKLDRTASATSCTLAAAQGSWDDVPVRLVEPVTVEWSAGRLDVAPCQIAVAGGTVRTEARYASDSLSLKTTFEKLPLDCIRAIASGVAAGRIEIQGQRDALNGAAEIRLSDVRFSNPALSDLPAAALDVNATLHDGQFRVEARDDGKLLGTPVSADVALPLQASLSPMSVALPKDGKLNGHLSAQAQLDRIGQIFLPDDQRLQGTFEARLTLAGTVGRPEVTGQISVEKGAYDHYGMGTTLRDVRAVFTGDGTRLKLDEGVATDGGEGRVSAHGWLDLDPERGFPLDLSISIEKSRLIQRDDMTATVGGQLTLSGAAPLNRGVQTASGRAQHLALAGKLRVDSAEYRLVSRSARPVSSIEVIGSQRVASHPENAAKPRASSQALRNIALDLDVDMPGRLFVRGSGLESQWKGRLAITGVLAQPTVKGEVTVANGRFRVLGKRFLLTDGDVVFNGEWPPAPRLSIASEAKVQDMTVYLKIAGSASAPEVALSSDPAAPQDEILARLLFGRSVDKISPVQALQLAEAAEAFSGGPGIFQTTDRVRRILRLDDLGINQDAKDGKDTSITAGKYLGENVYLGVEQGTKSDSSKVRAEVELTPELSLEGATGRNAQSGIGLKWKRDY